ncbi:MAG TPA: DUF4058 family protein [Gemmataceae bacterium]|nr:DUF4058 family protein [Gemmataceae bacterium]
MPLRDHFRPPAEKYASWEAVHGGWPMLIVMSLVSKLPTRYVAHPRVHLGAFAEIDVTTYEQDQSAAAEPAATDDGGVSTAVWAPPKPTLTVATQLPAQDEYEVRVYDMKRDKRLVAAIELVSPANKDRPENRSAFVAKCATLLQHQVSVTIVDPITIRQQNLYAELLELLDRKDPALGAEPPATYAVACRAIPTSAKPGAAWQLETWLKPMDVGKPLPTLPLWLAENLSVPLDLEISYEETCKFLRIP